MEQPPSKPRAARRKKQLPWILSGALLMGAMGVIVAQKHEESISDSYMEQRLQPDSEHWAALERLTREANEQLRAEQWSEARETLLELQSIGPLAPAMQETLRLAEREAPNQKHLAASEAALAAHDLALAASELSQVQPSTRMSVWLNRQQLALTAATAAQAPPVEPPPISPQLAWEKAQEHFFQGEVASAISMAEQCEQQLPECKAGLQDLREFATLDKKPKELELNQLSRLIELERRLLGPKRPSRVARNTGMLAARIFYKGAQEAQSAGQWERAVQYAQRTLDVDKANKGAASILNELHAKAQDSLKEAYTLSKSSPKKAILKLRSAMAMTAPDDEVHRMAQQLLGKLKG
jgi:hypothetical protein